MTDGQRLVAGNAALTKLADRISSGIERRHRPHGALSRLGRVAHGDRPGTAVDSGVRSREIAAERPYQTQQRIVGRHDERTAKGIDWKTNGVKVSRDQLDTNTPQTSRHEPRRDQFRPRWGAEDLGRHGPSTQRQDRAHHHGRVESVNTSSRAGAMRWGEHLELSPRQSGDFIFIRPMCRIRRSCLDRRDPGIVLVRSDNEAVVVNLRHEPVEKPEECADRPIHARGKRATRFTPQSDWLETRRPRGT